MPGERIGYLLQQYAANRASKEEVEEMFVWLQSVEGGEALKGLIMEKDGNEAPGITLSQQDWDKMWAAIKGAANEPPRKSLFRTMVRLQAAAAVILLVLTGGLFLLMHKEGRKVPSSLAVSQYRNDIPAGGNKAILTLANGSTIVLNGAQKGLLAQQGNTNVVKLANGALAYHTQNKNTSALLYNTISTPRGGQYQMVLPDGSNVWLNAASSLHFPTSFAGNERVVELSGEAYFEVAHVVSSVTGKKIPFHVKVNGMDVEVVGTHFNIMAYSNEQSIRTTLLEGKVNVTQNGITQKLEPGRQAIVDNATHAITVADANTEQAVAWKNGLFRFKMTGIKELMRQVERWYDVDVEYKTMRNDQDYTGIVPRAQNVSALLKMLEVTGTVHFRVEGKKIIVLP